MVLILLGLLVKQSIEELTINGCDINAINSMINGTFLQGHEQGIVDTANSYGVNGYYIVARLIQVV